jgi:hypothetical protein
MTGMPTKILPLVVLICLVFSSCGGNDKGAPANPDEQLIQQMIQEWIAFAEDGDAVSLETFFVPSYWTQSPTSARLGELTGRSLSASAILVGAEGDNANASFTLAVAGGQSMGVTWGLQKTDGKWLIYYEEWAS